MVVPAERVELLAGTPVGFDKTADSGRVVRVQACGACGIKVWIEPLAAPGTLILKPGTLDDSGWAVPIGNIWTGSALPWVEIDPGEVNFPGQPADRKPLIDAWSQAVAG